jgi:DNA-binding MarR family transcriptional regulator
MPAVRPEPKTPPPDYVSRLVEAWHAERPDLVVEPVAIVYRVQRLAARLWPEVEKPFKSSGVTGADFSVLAYLRRAGHPYQVSQRALQEALGLTSGTMSVRIDRLAESGLISRDVDQADGRAVLITLTAQGLEAFDALAPRHLDNEARLISSLDPAEQATLARLLHALLVEFEALLDRPGRELGLAVAPAHVTLERRRAVGLPDSLGLLVEEVTSGSPADRAGIRQGDMLVSSAVSELRSLTCLASAIAEARGEVPLTVLRGETTIDARVTKTADLQ